MAPADSASRFLYVAIAEEGLPGVEMQGNMSERETSTPDVVCPQPAGDGLDQIRGRFVDATLFTLSAFGVPAVVASVYRSLEVGWHPLVAVHILAAFSVITVTLFRRRLSLRTRSLFLVFFFLVLGGGALYTWGLVGMGISWLIFSSICATLFFGIRSGLFVTASGLLMATLVFLGVHFKIVTFSFDLLTLALAPGHWITSIIGFVLLTTIVVVTIGRLHRWLIRSNEDLRREIEDRKRAESMLRRYERIVASSSDLMALMDVDLVIQAANEAFLKAGEASREEILGRSFPEFLRPEACRKTAQAHLSACLLGRHVRYQDQVDLAGLGTRFMDVVLDPIVEEGERVSGIVVGFRDITRVRQLENQLRQASKMEAIGTLAGGIAHDFNNILMAIMGSTELLLLDAEQDSRTRSFLEQIFRAGVRGKALVEQILSFSRRAELDRKPIDLMRIIHEAMDFLRSSLPSTIEIRRNIEVSSATIMGNPTQIHQILMNLCTNATQAMKGRMGQIDVDLKEAEVDAGVERLRPGLKQGSYLQLTVADTGCGMRKEVADRIFEPFFTTKDRGEGMGMGLAVVHGIVKAHDGAIFVESQPGRGSAFHIFFPRLKGEPQREEERKAPRPATRKARILFVDDEESIADVQRELLDHIGYEVVARTSSREALEIFRSDPRRFDLVITDLTMPNLTGVELAREMVRIRPDIAIILCTGFSDTMDPGKAREIGIREILRKPVLASDMCKAIRKALS